MEPVLGSISSIYQHGIVDHGRESQFLFFVAFLLTFGFIRTSAHMIRAQVSWWPGNVEVGGTHIHHLVWGILLLLLVGYGWLVEVGTGSRSSSLLMSRLMSLLYGAAAALTLDEFALWLNLQDVYWAKQGRESIDAVVLFGSLLSMGLVGKEFLRELARLSEDVEHEGVEDLEHGHNGAGVRQGSSSLGSGALGQYPCCGSHAADARPVAPPGTTPDPQHSTAAAHAAADRSGGPAASPGPMGGDACRKLSRRQPSARSRHPGGARARS